MDKRQVSLLDAWDYIEKEYSIPPIPSVTYAVGVAAGGAGGIGAKVAGTGIAAAAVVGGVAGAVTEALSTQKKEVIDKDKVPDDLFKNECAAFYKMICQYCDERNITESQLYNLAKVSRAVYSNIRSMAHKNYIPSKNTIIQLCIALHLELIKAQELLGILGYKLSNNLIVDKVVAWCLEQQDMEYDVDSINDIIYEKTNGQYCLLKA